jgi:hypothetical protein
LKQAAAGSKVSKGIVSHYLTITRLAPATPAQYQGQTHERLDIPVLAGVVAGEIVEVDSDNRIIMHIAALVSRENTEQTAYKILSLFAPDKNPEGRCVMLLSWICLDP